MVDASNYSIAEIQFFPAILDELGSLIDPTTKYSMQIEVPPIVNQGVDQVIPVKITKKFSLGEKITLYLMPSDSVVPTLKYKVSYYKIGYKIPILQETWVIPQPLKDVRYSLRVGPDNLTYDLPANFWQFKSLIDSPALPDFSFQTNTMVFLTPPPDIQFSFLYTGKYTRKDILWPGKY